MSACASDVAEPSASAAEPAILASSAQTYRLGGPPPIQPLPGKVTHRGSVRGQVVDAVSGAPLDGSVSTTAACAGSGCAPDASGEISTALTAGAFHFDAYAAAPSQLSLRPESAFRITVPGYQSLLVAHGPASAVAYDEHGQEYSELAVIYLCPEGEADSDADGLCDAAEERYGTEPWNADSDGDALSDGLELLGHPRSGAPIYDIFGLGADPLHADVFLELHYTPGSNFIRPAVDMVVAAFDAAPTRNPDHTTGVRLHVLLDDAPLWGESDVVALWDDFERIARAHFAPERPLALHYGLFASAIAGRTASGSSRDIGAAEFVVTVPRGNQLEQAGTLMHELGHNLGLKHGGDDHDVYKPQYISVMNYNYQFFGLPRGAGNELDYARIQIGVFDENSFNEQAPFVPYGRTTMAELAQYVNPRVYVGRGQPNTQYGIGTLAGSLAGPLDLNRRNGIETQPQSFDFDGDGWLKRYPPTRDDWATLTFHGGETGWVGDVVRNQRRDLPSEGANPPCQDAP